MWRIKIKLAFIGVILFHQVSAQNFGFNGKKNTISLFSTGGVRLFPIVLGEFGLGSNNKIYTVKYNSNNQLKKRITIPRYDLRFSYTRLVSKHFGIGAEFGYEKFGLPVLKSGSSFSDEYGYYEHKKQSTPVFNVFSYMLVFEFHSSRGAAPIGLSSSLGIGPKIYQFNYKQNYRYGETVPMELPYSNGARDIVAINLFYQLNFKKVINRFVTFDIGMRLHTGIVLPTLGNNPDDGEYERARMRDELFIHNLGSLVSLRTGFSFLL